MFVGVSVGVGVGVMRVASKVNSTATICGLQQSTIQPANMLFTPPRIYPGGSDPVNEFVVQVQKKHPGKLKGQLLFDKNVCQVTKFTSISKILVPHSK